MKRIISILLLLVIISQRIFADGVTLVANAPSTVEVGDKFRVQFTVNTQGASHFTPPDFKGFEVIYGPSTSSQSSVQFINGRTTQTSSITYTFVVLCSVAGTYTINPASITAEGKVVKSNPIKVKVLPLGQGGNASNQSGGAGRSSASGQSPQSSASGANVSANELFMTATASRTRVYEQEAILLTYKLYSTVNLTQLDGKLPSLDGFQIQEIDLPRNKEWQLDQYNGRNYRSVVWSQYVLFPQKSGDLVIPPVSYEGVVVVRNRYIDPIEAFFNGVSGMQEMKKKIVAPELTIHVSPLPAKPANFSGAVGKFTLSSSISQTELDANDAVTLKMSVKGTGNMKLISTPEVLFPKDFETYDAKVNDKFSLTRGGLSGSKEFEYLAVPRHGGTYTIPPVEFVYFDTDTRTYKTLKSEAYTLKVNRGKGSNVQTADYSNNQQDVKELNQDIRYIKLGDVSLHETGEQLWGTWRYVLYYAVPFLVFIVVLIAGSKRMAANHDLVRVRGRKANKIALKRMKKANKLLAEKKQGEFYDEVLRAMLGYVADKLNIPQEHLNKDNIQSELSANNVSEEHINAFIKTLNDCEFARYAPGDATANMANVYDSAIRTITQMEDTI